MTAAPTKTDQAGAPAGKESQAQQIARLSNDRLLQLKQEVEKFYSELDYTSFSLRLEGQRPELEAIRKQVSEFKAALEVEYVARLLHGYRSRLQKLLQALLPSQEAGGRGRLIPINAAAAAQEEQAQPEDPLQAAITEFTGRLRAMLAPESTEGQATSPAPEVQG
jgi:hypothetical protein